jgi:hypothetical protein
MASIVNFAVEAYFAGTPDITLVIWVNHDNDSNFSICLCCVVILYLSSLIWYYVIPPLDVWIPFGVAIQFLTFMKIW